VKTTKKKAKKPVAKKRRPARSAPKTFDRERRWAVSLRGGVVTMGSYSLDVKGQVYVMAKSEAEALENGLAVIRFMQETGRTLPDDGLDLEIVGARPAGPGDVEELPPGPCGGCGNASCTCDETPATAPASAESPAPVGPEATTAAPAATTSPDPVAVTAPASSAP
jgi:hypothetical protein